LAGGVPDIMVAFGGYSGTRRAERDVLDFSNFGTLGQ